MIVRRLPYVPADPIGCWPFLHPNPRQGFILGSGAGTSRDHFVFMSAAEPAKILRQEDILKHRLTDRKSHALPRYVGFFSFDAGRWFDPALSRLPRRPNPLGTPVALFGDYRNLVKFDLKKKQTTIVAENHFTFKRILNILSEHRSDGCPDESGGAKKKSRRVSFTHKTPNQFAGMVKRAKEFIRAGDIYQANLSLRFERKFLGDPFIFYRRLCQRNPSPYAALLKMDSKWMVSASPELLVSVNKKYVTTRPIAGTRPRGQNARDDQRKRGQLLLSPKERAEHIMLVDLERNDLGRVCDPGSVKVTESFAVERYSHVMHIVSEVGGRLRKKLSAMDAVRALFPGGTITGCPKYRSIEIIEALEGVSRGPFYGSIGYFAPNGDAIFNIIIRTAVISGGRVALQAGAGVVADSNPRREYRESLAKARILLEVLSELCTKSLKTP